MKKFKQIQAVKPLSWRKEATEKKIQTKKEVIQESKMLFSKIRLQYLSYMIDIYKKQKADVEINIKQLKGR